MIKFALKFVKFIFKVALVSAVGRRTAAALRAMADVGCTGKTGTDVSAGIRASGKSDCRSKNTEK